PKDRARTAPGSPLAQGQVNAPSRTLPRKESEKELSLLAVEPHPDDESIGMGGTLARYSAEGGRTTLVTATRGEVGEILDKDLDPKEAAPRLATIREGELRNAVKILGVNELVFLGYEDSGMAGLPRNRERGTFWQADEEEAIGRLIQVVRRVRPQVLVTQNEFGGYGHPDHIKTHRVAIGGFYYASDVERFPGGEPFRPSKLYYSAFPKSLMRQMAEAMQRAGVENRFSTDGEPPPFAVSDDRVTTWLDVSPYVDKKLAAMRAHRTQIPEDSWFLKLNEALGPRPGGRRLLNAFAARSTPPSRRTIFSPGFDDGDDSYCARPGRVATAAGTIGHRVHRRGDFGGERHPALSRRRRAVDQVRSVQSRPHRDVSKGSGTVLDL